MNDARIVRFCDEGLRPAMTKLAEAYETARRLIETYDATGLEAIIGDAKTVIEDRSPEAGRPPITAPGVKLIMGNVRALLEQLDTVNPQIGASLIAGARSVTTRYGG